MSLASLRRLRTAMTDEEYIEHLEFVVGQLTMEPDDNPAGLSPREARMLGYLQSRPGQYCSREAIAAALYADRDVDDWPVDALGCVGQFAWRIKAKIAKRPIGWIVEGKSGVGGGNRAIRVDE
jgi:DNA-binding response OmpR family regulator